MSRATKAYVSGTDLSRVHQSSLYRFAKRPYVANFNGAMAAGRTIVSATWRIDCPEIAVMSNAAISTDQRETSILLAAQLGGFANLRAEVTLDDGSVLNQVFCVNVREATWYSDDPTLQIGPYSLTVTAP